MISFPKANSKALVILILALALGVRIIGYEYVPFQSDGDEVAYIFAGQSLLQEGMPISWSGFDVYGPEHEVKRIVGDPTTGTDNQFRLVKPWFDHPYLLSVIIGGWSLLFGYDTLEIPPSLIYRLPMIALSFISITLLYLIAKQIFSHKSALISLIVFGFSPSVVLIQRMVVGENLVMPLMLASLYFALKRKSLLFSILFAALAGLAKTVGIITIPLLCLYLITQKRYRDAIVSGIFASIFFFLLWFGYAATIDFDHFLQVTKVQSYRLLGWANPAFIFSHPGFHIRTMLDMSYYLLLITGFASLFLFKKDDPNRTFLSIAVMVLLLLVWVTSAEQDMLGWYKLPLFTFLGLIAGISAIKNRFIFHALVIITLINNLGLTRDVAHPLPEPQVLRLVLMVVFGLLFLLELVSMQKQLSFLSKKSTLLTPVLLSLYILQSVYISANLYQSICQHQACPIPQQTVSSQFRKLLP